MSITHWQSVLVLPVSPGIVGFYFLSAVELTSGIDARSSPLTAVVGSIGLVAALTAVRVAPSMSTRELAVR